MYSYYIDQINKIEKWKKEEPGVVSKVIGYVTSPISKLTTLIVPQKAIEGLLSLASSIAESCTDSSDIIRDGGVKEVSELRSKDLKLSNKLSHEVANWARGIAGAEGAGAGAAGLIGVAADVTFIIPFALRTINKIGLCYGYECNSENGLNLMYCILSAAGSNTVKEKIAALANLQVIKNLILKNTWKKIAQQAAKNAPHAVAIMGAKKLAGILGKNLTKRKALQAVPYLGAAVGLSMNIAFINDVIDASVYTFQELWLKDNGLWVDTQ